MHSVDLLQAIRVAVFVVVCLGILFSLAVWAGRRLALQAARDQTAERLREERKLRLERLLEIAEDYDKAPNTSERQRLYREAASLGFHDEPDERPFALDMPDDPPTPQRAA